MRNRDHLKLVGRAACILLTGGLVLAGANLAAQHLQLVLLERVEAGEWEIRDRSSKLPSERRCIGHGRKFIQLRHAQITCRQYVVEDTAKVVTVNYSCPGKGFGLTRIRLENARLAQIETQGVANGLPFDFVAEVRRLGDCKL
jgi:hypothetical protein